MKLPFPHSLHLFAKRNISQKTDSLGTYDVYGCEKCGVTGKKYTANSFLIVDDCEYTKSHLQKCVDGYVDVYIGRSVMITSGFDADEAKTHPFLNITEKSIHAVVLPPKGYFNQCDSVWVKGSADEPIRLLSSEFKFCEPSIKRTK